jgi:hypothetical protein
VSAGRARISQVMSALERGAPPRERGRFSFGSGYTVRVANDLESRQKAYRLVYRLYLEKEYAQPRPSRMWLSIFDALPETTTLLIERTDTGAAVGALTVAVDSPMGLPADKLYGPELDALRASGRRLAEIVSLGVADDLAGGMQVLVKLFNFGYFVARGLQGVTDFVVTVNPRHVNFYQRLMLFEAAGPEREYAKVGGAPAVLLRLDLAVPEEQVRLERGPQELRPTRSRTIYKSFLTVREEPAVVAGLRGSLRPMSSREIGYFLVAETDILAEASEEQRAVIGKLHPVGALLSEEVFSRQ